MSLNNVVNNLVRAAAGIPFDISDSDLDRHVAALLASEAKAKEKSWSELGLSAFLGTSRDSPDPSQPKPNKRFLASVIRNVDGHNASLIRAQERAAREVRDEKGYGYSSSRGESSRSGAGRLFGGALKGMGGERREREWERGRKGKERDDGRGGEREGREREHGYSRDRDRGRAREGERDDPRYRGSRRDGGGGRSRSRSRDRDRNQDTDRDRARDRNRDRDRDRRKDKDKIGDRDQDTRGVGEMDGRRRRNGDTDLERNARRAKDTVLKTNHDREDGERRAEARRRKYAEYDREEERRQRAERSDKRHDGGDEREQEEPLTHRRTSVERDEGSEQELKRDRLKRDDRDDFEERSKKILSGPDGIILLKSKTRAATSPLNSASSGDEIDSHVPPAVSKMDKYFANTYDPRLDLGAVPKEGMISAVGWDNMLAVLKERGRKRRHHSPSLSDDIMGVPAGITLRSPSPDLSSSARRLEKAEKKRRKEERRKRRGLDSDEESEKRAERKKKEKARESVGMISDGKGMFDVAYSKKGAVREWDVGK